MECIEGGIGRHEPVPDVRFNDLRHRRCDFEQRKLLGQREGSLPARILAIPQLKKDRLACHQHVAFARTQPPALSPDSAS